MTTTRPIIVAQICQGVEKNTVTCQTAEEARRLISEGNARAAKGFCWGLSKSNWQDDDGVPLTIDQANEIRAAVGVPTY